MTTLTVEEQLRHDRINLGRIIKRLEASIDDGLLNGSNLSNREGAWVIVQGVTQKLKYARKIFSNIEMSESFNPQSSYLQAIRNTLCRLEEVVELANSQVEPPRCIDVDYLSLVSLPPPAEDIVAPANIKQPSTSVETVVSDEPSPSAPSTESPTIPVSSMPSSQGPAALLPSSSTQGSLLSSSSLKAHDELSDELARMATQLRRNAEHFSAILEKDKGLVVSAEDGLSKNADSMTRERDRLKKHSSKSFGTTWFTIGTILVVCLAFVWMLVIMRVT